MKSDRYTGYWRDATKILARFSGSGRLQSGDPMTTWYNTFAILLFLNYYLRDFDFDLARPDHDIQRVRLYVSGDDQLIFAHPDKIDEIATRLKLFVRESPKGGLGRICDPIHVNPVGKSWEFISRIFRNVNQRVEQIRDPVKLIATA